MRRASSALRASLLIAVGVALAVGCSGDEDETTPVAPPGGPPKVRITAIRTSSGASFEVGSGAPATLQAGCDPDRTLGVDLGFEFFTRRPPGACGGTLQCGSVLVTVEGPGGKKYSVRSTAASVPVPLSDPPFEPGQHVVTAELRDDANAPLTVTDAEPSHSVTVDVLAAPATCGAKDGGADASEGDAGDGGAGDASEAGTGDAAPDVSNDGPSDARPDSSDAAGDQTESDSPGDVEQDQG